MTKLLKTAIARVRTLPRRDQDRAAEQLLQFVGGRWSDEHVSAEELQDAFDSGDFSTIARWRRELGFDDL